MFLANRQEGRYKVSDLILGSSSILLLLTQLLKSVTISNIKLIDI